MKHIVVAVIYISIFIVNSTIAVPAVLVWCWGEDGTHPPEDK